MSFGNAWGHDAGLSYTAKDARTLARSLANARTGVVGESDLLVTQQASPATTVRAAAGGVLIAATGAGLFGYYHAYNDASLDSPAFTATSGSGRKDLLIVRVTAGIPALEIVQGTPSGSPAEPAVTGDNYEVLALITFPASTTNVTTAMITDRRTASYAQLPHTLLRRRVMGALNTFNNPGSYTVFPVAADRTALTMTFVKARADTKLVLHAYGSFYNDSGLAQACWLGLRRGGATDYDVAVGRVLQALSYGELSGCAEIIGLAAGSYTFEPVFKTGSGIVAKWESAIDACSYTVEETF